MSSLGNDYMKIYRLAYKQEYKWEHYLDETKMKFFDILWKGRCVHPTMAIPAFMTTVASLAGPNAKVQAHPHSTSSPIILYMFSICAPGGGKSTAFETVVLPAGEVYEKDVGQSLLIENYTQAGLQNHQFDCGGYGLLASDEGIRVLSAIHGKQVKNEGERQFLCKSWNGLGDYTLLREKHRGYSETALCMLLYMQPEPFLGEFRHYSEDDGLKDRCVLTTLKPFLFQSDILSENAQLYKRNYSKVITNIYQGVYNWHKATQRTYIFDPQAQEFYNEISDEIVREFNDLYNSDEDDTFNLSHETAQNITSKDVVQLSRCSTALHIFISALDLVLAGKPVTIQNSIPLSTVKLAHHFYTIASKQKAIFVEAIQKTDKTKKFLVTDVRSTYQKVVKAVFKMDGPLVLPREVGKKLYGIYAHVVREELQAMEANGLGTLKARKEDRIPKETFFKVPPSVLSEFDESLITSDMSIVTYKLNFNNYSKMEKLNLKHLLRWHPHKNDLDETVDSVDNSQLNEQSLPSFDISYVQNSQSEINTSQRSIATESVASSPESIIIQTKRKRVSKNDGKGTKVSRKNTCSMSLETTHSSSGSIHSLASNLGDISPAHHSTPYDEVLHDHRTELATDSSVNNANEHECTNSENDLQIDSVLQEVGLSPAHSNVSDNERLQTNVLNEGYVSESVLNVGHNPLPSEAEETNNVVRVNPKVCLVTEKETLNWSRPNDWNAVLKNNRDNVSETSSMNTFSNLNAEECTQTVSTSIQTDQSHVNVKRCTKSKVCNKTNSPKPDYSPPKLRSQTSKNT